MGVGDTAAWRLNILCFAVLTTRERDIEITQRPQRDSCFLCVSLRRSGCVRVTCMFLCVRVPTCACMGVCVCVPVGSKGVKLPRHQSLGGA